MARPERRAQGRSRRWLGALALALLWSSFALTLHHYSLAQHPAKEICDLCLAGSASAQGPAAIPAFMPEAGASPAPRPLREILLSLRPLALLRARAPPAMTV